MIVRSYMKLKVFSVLLILLLGTPAYADYAKGKEASDRGDYETALKEWKPLAEQGDAYRTLKTISNMVHSHGNT